MDVLHGSPLVELAVVAGDWLLCLMALPLTTNFALLLCYSLLTCTWTDYDMLADRHAMKRYAHCFTFRPHARKISYLRTVDVNFVEHSSAAPPLEDSTT